MRQGRIVGVSLVAKFLSVLVQGQPPNSLRSHPCVPFSPTSQPAFAATSAAPPPSNTASWSRLIAVVIIVAVTLLGGNLNETRSTHVQCSVKGGTYTAAPAAARHADGSLLEVALQIDHVRVGEGSGLSQPCLVQAPVHQQSRKAVPHVQNNGTGRRRGGVRPPGTGPGDAAAWHHGVRPGLQRAELTSPAPPAKAFGSWQSATTQPPPGPRPRTQPVAAATRAERRQHHHQPRQRAPPAPR